MAAETGSRALADYASLPGTVDYTANIFTNYEFREGARAACEGMRHSGLETYALQTLHSELP